MGRAFEVWSKKTGLNTWCFWISLLCGYLFVGIGLSTLLSALNVPHNKFLSVGSDYNASSIGVACLAYGALWCYACNAVFRRQRKGVYLTAFLTLPWIFTLWWQCPVMAISIVATVLAYGLLAEAKRFPEDPVAKEAANSNAGSSRIINLDAMTTSPSANPDCHLTQKL